MARLRIEPGRGLVEQQHLRIVHERPGDRQPSLHPARQRLDLVVRAFAQLDEIDELIRPPAEVAPGQTEVAAVDDDVLADRQLHVQRVLLRHDAEPRANVCALRHRIQAEDAERSLRRRRDAPDHSHRRRLSRSVRSEKAEGLAALHVEVDTVHGDELAETLDQPAGVHQRQRCACIHHAFNLPTAAGTGAIASGRDAGGCSGRPSGDGGCGD